MLACVAHEQHSAIPLEPMQELVHLFRACEARFVENVQPFLFTLRLLASRQMPLQGARFDSGLPEFLRRAGCRREAFHSVPSRSAASRIAANEVVFPAPAKPSSRACQFFWDTRACELRRSTTLLGFVLVRSSWRPMSAAPGRRTSRNKKYTAGTGKSAPA